MATTHFKLFPSFEFLVFSMEKLLRKEALREVLSKQLHLRLNGVATRERRRITIQIELLLTRQLTRPPDRPQLASIAFGKASIN